MNTHPVTAVAAISDIEAAHRGHAQAVDRLRALEGELEQAFAGLRKARAELHTRAGVDAIVSFTEPMTCAFDRWTATEDAKEMADRAPTVESLDAHREAQAIDLANSHNNKV